MTLANATPAGQPWPLWLVHGKSQQSQQEVCQHRSTCQRCSPAEAVSVLTAFAVLEASSLAG